MIIIGIKKRERKKEDRRNQCERIDRWEIKEGFADLKKYVNLLFILRDQKG